MDQAYKNKHLIRKYIQQECTGKELEELKILMSLPEASELFDQVLSEKWTGFSEEGGHSSNEIDLQLHKFYQKLETNEAEALERKAVQESIHKSILRPGYFRYAAVLALMILGLGIYQILPSKKTLVKEQVAMRELNNAKGQRSKVVLPDGSRVFLGAASKLIFPEQFTSKSRTVKLEGEAFFEVNRNPNQPFIVQTGTIQTRVLGTSFKIEAFRNQALIVAVATGKVRVDQYEGKEMEQLALLSPGQTISYHQGKVNNGQVSPEEINSWKDARLSFHQQSLKEISSTLERWYNVSFSFENKTKEKEKISVTLKADVPLHKIMKVLAATGHFNYRIDENTRKVQIY
ncbi:FecR family protein [Pedobacter gandavensis]|uniref:FecR family protein n=1 Tax=Pedobacter gandavensis TaxID=2679963 RepID=UPI0029309D7C|nr:FecR domain-containing protein [Pedobacter gandavensis]